ncbi:MAG TPA: hypothetical protein DEB46_14915, partial [Myxococcales bacterium]|nr:hypothetical protein [Myxococcales bacterium]
MRYALFCLLSLTLACPEQVVIREVEASCGDGEVQAGEACDDGNDVDTDACTASCRVAQCGDGITRGDLGPEEAGFEACDDGNTLDADACTSLCATAFCGDGVLRSDLSEGHPDFEACDDGNTADQDECLNNCQPARCGDG